MSLKRPDIAQGRKFWVLKPFSDTQFSGYFFLLKNHDGNIKLYKTLVDNQDLLQD